MDLPIESTGGVSLTMEQQFRYRTFCDSIDACRDVDALRNVVKDITKQMMIKEQLTKELFKAELGIPDLN